MLDWNYFTQHIQCSRDDKWDSLYIVQLLLDLAVTAREKGLVAMDQLVEEENGRFTMPFLRKAVQLVVDVGSIEKIEKVLYQYILSSNFSGRQFLVSMVIAETMMAIHRDDDLDYIFYFLIPSMFGCDFEENVADVYRNYRNSMQKKVKS